MTAAIFVLVVAVAVAMMLRHLQRTLFYPQPRSMPDAVDESMETALERFEDALERHAPGVLSGLQPGLSDERILEIESRYRFRLTDDLCALYRWRNGSPPDKRANLIPGHWFVPLEYAGEQREVSRRQISGQTLVHRLLYWVFAGHRTTWLTVLDDRCGDGYFYDPSRRRSGASFFYHFAEDRRYRFFPSLANFLAGATECYELGIYRRSVPSLEDIERSFEVWDGYATSPGS